MAHLPLDDYRYALPDDRIARFPAEPRDAARLLVYRGGAIDHRTFQDLPDVLPAGALLVFNDTRVIPARLPFRRASGAAVEIFLLQPVAPSPLVELAMRQTGTVTWEALVGNRKRWRTDEALMQTAGDLRVVATWS
ncbi:MAG: S-adenosylmethionine:tRNA ribosyltransferase-isomerase, partial [Catalinimonas sp.]